MPAFEPFTFADYEVLEPLETVGGTTTYRARQVALRRDVTLTILPPDEAQKVAFRTRFDRQFMAASRLRHPNVVAAIDAGELNGHRYIVAEYAGSRRLSDALDDKEWFPIRRCVAIALDMAQALVHLASNRIVHRGITPQAIVLAESGVAKLRGFSLSKEQVQNPNETWFDLDVYAACYTPPEVVQLKPHIDARSDIYALGCVLYHMVTGRPPFLGKDASATLMKHVNEDIPDPRTLREDLPESLASVMASCLERDREARYQDARQVVEDLKDIQEGRARQGAAVKATGILGWLRPRARR